MSLESRLWREVSQHLELAESVERIFELLRPRLDIEALVLRRVEAAPDRISTLASTFSEEKEASSILTARRTVSAGEKSLLLAWLSRGGSSSSEALPPLVRELMGGAARRFLVASLLPRGQADSYVLLPLRDGIDGSRHLDLLEEIRGPLAVAIENDLRIQELARHKEALEADRNSLISRLQRQDISEVVVGESGGLKNVLEQIDQVAPTDVPVIILGETGSGKEVIARAIHARSHRAKGPVVRINCGAIPSELIDSELFGHERGAFTGAVSTRKGWFERADGGTLFLDEIGELSLAAQVRLLRVLQEGTLERVGGHQTIAVDVRIVAATHRRLELMVADGSFREDLWYRLSVFPVHLPPLRERLEDLPALARHFAEHAGRRLGLGDQLLLPSSTDLELLARYSWPGNVRELAAVIERAAILGRGKKLELASALGANLSPVARASSYPPRPSLLSMERREAQEADTRLPTLDQAMAAHIEKALIRAKGRIEGRDGAADLLGINPHTLRARMKKLGVNWNRFRALASEGEGEPESAEPQLSTQLESA